MAREVNGALLKGAVPFHVKSHGGKDVISNDVLKIGQNGAATGLEC